jgi:branched-chain amino acid transport system permease protein
VSVFLALTVVGIVYGCVYAITAAGLVVTYTTSGVFNFAHGAVGMMGAFMYWQLSVGWGVPVPLALFLVLFVIAPLFGALVERLLIRPLYDAPLGATLVVTVGLLLALIGIANVIWSPETPRILTPFFQNKQFAFPGVNVSAHELIVVAASLLVAVALRLFFTRTRLGATMRAVVDDPTLVALAGASPRSVSQLSWALGSSLAALAGILLAPLVQLDILTLTLLVIDGYAAAVVGRLKNLPLTVAGGILLGLAESYSTGYINGNLANDLRPALPMFLLFIAVIVLRDERLRGGRMLRGWTPRIVSLRRSVVAAVGFIAAAIVADFVLPSGALPDFGQALALAFILLSLVLLTGYGGQVSLAQMTFVGVGAVVMGKVAPGGSPLGALLAVALTGLLGVVVAIPVLRLRGLYLALGTLAFASGMDTLFFAHVLGTGGSINVPRLSAGVSFAGDHAYVALLAVVFALGAVAILAVRRSSFGRRLAAFNDSPAACVTLGAGVDSTKLLVFGISAAMAGLGGVLYGGQNGIVSASDFQLLNSLVLLLILTIGGVSTVTGAFAGALSYALFPVIQAHFPSLGEASYLLTGLGAISIGRNPDGIVGQIAKTWERLGARPSTVLPPASPAGLTPTTADYIASADKVVA